MGQDKPRRTGDEMKFPAQLMQAQHGIEQNGLLAALSAEDRARLLPELILVPLPLGWVVYESGDKQRYLYFPTSSIVSLLYLTEGGASAEVGMIGNEGLVGTALFMGGETMLGRAVVQSAGCAYRMRAEILQQELRYGGALQHLALRYMQALMTQVAQTAVCNRHHSLEQQVCRLLLQTMDRLRSNQLYMTQEVIANMLGVRREGVTEAAGKLQQAGMIRYRRGHITVLDRARLEAQACECYAVVEREYDRLLVAAPVTAMRWVRTGIALAA